MNPVMQDQFLILLNKMFVTILDNESGAGTN